MKVKLYDQAARNYIQRCYRHASPACGRLHRPEFAAMLEKVQGKWIEVETDWLFADQFNTVPIEGVSETGMRLMSGDVEEIQDDIRVGRIFDRYTHKNYATINHVPKECFENGREYYLVRWDANPNIYARGVILIETPLFRKHVSP